MSDIKPVNKVSLVNNQRKPIKFTSKLKRVNVLDFEGYYQMVLRGKLHYPAAI